jgi:hypothetical protein
MSEVKQDKKKSLVVQLVEYARQHCEILRDNENDRTLATISGTGTYAVDSSHFKQWLLRSSNIIASSTTVSDAVFVLGATWEEKVKTYQRVARVNDNIYINLMDKGRAVEITKDGWSVIEKSPVVFHAKKDVEALPIPEHGGSIKELHDFIYAGDDFTVLLGLILDTLKGRHPYIIALLNGEEGSSKTTITKLLGELIDPCIKAKTKRLPDDARSLSIMASNRHLLTFDNVSKLNDELSDALCRVATGAGMVERSLYTNEEEHIFGGANPIIINGIPEIGHRSDFLGRAIKINLPPIPENKRLEDVEFWRRFHDRRPYILGAVYDMVASGLRNYHDTKPESMPRMADSYRWLLSCEKGTEYNLGARLWENMKESVKGVALDTPIGKAIAEFMKDQFNDNFIWTGTPSQLHNILKVYYGRAVGHDPANGDYNYGEMKHYPSSARWLSGSINQISSSLRTNGIDIQRDRDTAKRSITIDAQEYFGRTMTLMTLDDAKVFA